MLTIFLGSFVLKLDHCSEGCWSSGIKIMEIKCMCYNCRHGKELNVNLLYDTDSVFKQLFCCSLVNIYLKSKCTVI